MLKRRSRCILQAQPTGPGLFNAETILVEEPQQCYLTYSWTWVGSKRVHTVLKCISLEVNVIARLEFELAYYDLTVQHVNHYSTRTPLPHAKSSGNTCEVPISGLNNLFTNS